MFSKETLKLAASIAAGVTEKGRVFASREGTLMTKHISLLLDDIGDMNGFQYGSEEYLEELRIRLNGERTDFVPNALLTFEGFVPGLVEQVTCNLEFIKQIAMPKVMDLASEMASSDPTQRTYTKRDYVHLVDVTEPVWFTELLADAKAKVGDNQGLTYVPMTNGVSRDDIRYVLDHSAFTSIPDGVSLDELVSHIDLYEGDIGNANYPEYSKYFALLSFYMALILNPTIENGLTSHEIEEGSLSGLANLIAQIENKISPFRAEASMDLIISRQSPDIDYCVLTEDNQKAVFVYKANIPSTAPAEDIVSAFLISDMPIGSFNKHISEEELAGMLTSWQYYRDTRLVPTGAITHGEFVRYMKGLNLERYQVGTFNTSQDDYEYLFGELVSEHGELFHAFTNDVPWADKVTDMAITSIDMLFYRYSNVGTLIRSIIKYADVDDESISYAVTKTYIDEVVSLFDEQIHTRRIEDFN